MLSKNLVFVYAAALVLALSLMQSAPAQRARFGDSFVIPNAQVGGSAMGTPATYQQPTTFQQPTMPIGQPQLPPNCANCPPVLPQMQTSGTVIQQPVFDPFAIQTPVITAPSGAQPIQPPPYIYPPPSSGQTIQPGATVGQPVIVQPGQFPSTYSNGSWAESAVAWPSQAWARLRSSEIYRLLERPRIRHTFLAGNSVGTELGLNETELATTLTIPNFLYTTQPLRISPGFVFHWWNGPNTPTSGADLPPRTYSTYFAFDYSTPWDRRIGGEANFTIGVYSDFQFSSSNSLRYTGVGLGWFRINNTTTFKLGVEYLHRVHIKILPAVGFFIYPSPNLKLDLYFPRPKIAQRLPSLGNFEIWGYVGGEYGGGSWTVERIGGMQDQADVNDIRTFLGLEWMGPRRVTGFFEVGYVFDREIVYRSDPTTLFLFDDTVMLRTGIAF